MRLQLLADNQNYKERDEILVKVVLVSALVICGFSLGSYFLNQKKW